MTVKLGSIWFWLKKNDSDFYFLKTFFYVTSGLVDMTSVKFHLRISFLFYVGLIHNLVKEI